MKKIVALMLALLMVFALAACKAAEPAAEEPAAEEATAEEPAAAEGLTQIFVWNNVILNLTSSQQQRTEGDMRTAYSIKDAYDACGIQGQDACQIIGSDGYAADEALSDLLQKYVTLEGENAPILVGEAQDPDWAVWEVAYLNFGTAAFMISYKDKISVKDMFDTLGMAEADSYDFIGTDGYVQNVPAADIAECYISWVDDRVDAEIPGLNGDTLWNVMTIQPAA